MEMDMIYNAMLAMLQSVNVQQADQTTQKNAEQSDTTFRKLMEKQSVDGGKATVELETDDNMGEDGIESLENQESDLELELLAAAVSMLQRPIVPVEQMNETLSDNNVSQVSAPMVTQSAEVSENDTVWQPQQQMRGEAETVETDSVEQKAPQNFSDELPTVSRNTTVESADMENSKKVIVSDTITEAAESIGNESALFRDVRDVMVKVGEAASVEDGEVLSESVGKQVGEQIIRALDCSEERISIRLEPGNLGRVEVEMTLTEQGTLHIELRAENKLTQRLLEKETAGLQYMLSHDSKQTVQVQVMQQDESRQQTFEDGNHDGGQRNPQQEQRKERHAENDFLQQLRLGLVSLDGEAS